jgi:hypothetical protein
MKIIYFKESITKLRKFIAEKTDREIFDPIYQNLKKKAMEDENEELKEVKSTSVDVVPKRESKCISKDILKSSLSEPLIENVDAVDETEEITEL